MGDYMNITLNKNDEIVIKLLHYFITIQGYAPVVLHGAKDEIWLEKSDADYKIVRIVSNYIHNDEQLDFDIFRTKQILKRVKRKMFAFNMNTLSIFVNLGDNVNLDNKNFDNIECANVKEINDLKTVVGQNAADGEQAASGLLKEITDIKEFVGIVPGESEGPTMQDRIDELENIIGKESDNENPATGLQKEIDDLQVLIGKNAADGEQAASGLLKEINDLKDFVGIGEVEEGEEQGPTLQSKIDDLNEEVETIKEDLLKYWVGTQAQYDALKEKEQGKLYIIIN
jgi:hypothetical protein